MILKTGYSWLSSDAEDAPDGGEKGLLPLEWALCFEGSGAQGVCRVRVKRQKEGVDEENRVLGERVREVWRRQRDEDED